MCARDNGVEILIDGHIKGRVFTNDSNAKEMFIKALERVEEQNAKGYKLTDCDKNSWWEDFKAYGGYSEQILANSAKTCKDEQASTDKVESKFKVGDWIVDTNGNAKKIINIKEGCYILEDDDGRYIINRGNADFRLWTINDAKSGDILMYGDGWTCIFKSVEDNEYFSSYCFMDPDEFFHYRCDEHLLELEDFGKPFPATEARRKMLFRSMANSGYAWDPDKKVLVETNDNSVSLD